MKDQKRRKEKVHSSQSICRKMMESQGSIRRFLGWASSEPQKGKIIANIRIRKPKSCLHNLISKILLSSGKSFKISSSKWLLLAAWQSHSTIVNWVIKIKNFCLKISLIKSWASTLSCVELLIHKMFIKTTKIRQIRSLRKIKQKRLINKDKSSQYRLTIGLLTQPSTIQVA